jgi:hypothetical protein
MIDIEVVGKKADAELVDPIECFGAPHGQVFQQYFNGEPQNEYLIGAGKCERPISIWYSDDSMNPDDPSHRISSESKKDLKKFNDSVKYMPIDAIVNIRLEVL